MRMCAGVSSSPTGVAVCEKPVLHGAGAPASPDVFEKTPSVHDSAFVEEVLDLAYKPPQGYPSLVATYREVRGNNVLVMVDGPRVYDALLEDIRNAKDHIHITTYLLGHDDFGMKLARMLAEKAREGVQVRLMVDPFGSHLWPKTASRDTLQRLSLLENVTVMMGTPLMQRPDHQKIVVIDGRVGYEGSANLVEGTASGDVHDVMLRIEGPAVWQAQSEFLRKFLWRGGRLETDTLTRAQVKEKYFPTPHVYPGGLPLQWVQSIPGYHEDIRRVTLDLIEHATKDIVIAYPYFTCTVLLKALERAAQRGVRIRMMIPWLSDHASCTAATRAWYPSLWAAGDVRTYEYVGFNHLKLLIVDDAQVLIGSANGDDLSMYRIFEGNVLIRHPDFARQIRETVFEPDVRASVEVTEETYQPSLWEKAYQYLCYVGHGVLV